MRAINLTGLPNYRGFTLIEILIVMLISSILMIGTNAAYRQVHIIWADAEYKRPIYYQARIITETLRQELSSMYFPPKPESQEQTGEDESKPFIISISPDGTTEISFYTLTPYWHGGIKTGLISKVRYWFRKAAEGGYFVLERHEQLYAGEKPVGVETSTIIAEGLVEFAAAAVKAAENQDNENVPPKAVSVSLKWPEREKYPELNFAAVILIPVSAGLIP